MSSSRLLVLALLALQPWGGAARHLRGRRRLDAADDVAVPPEIREALNDAIDTVDDGGLYSDDVNESPAEPPLTPAKEDVVELPGEEEAEAHAEHTIYAYEYAEEEAVEDAYEYANDEEEQATWRCGSDGCHPMTDEEREAALREQFDAVGETPFYADDADPRDPDVAFFYAEEANHDQEEAIFEELYGT